MLFEVVCSEVQYAQTQHGHEIRMENPRKPCVSFGIAQFGTPYSKIIQRRIGILKARDDPGS